MRVRCAAAMAAALPLCILTTTRGAEGAETNEPYAEERPTSWAMGLGLGLMSSPGFGLSGGQAAGGLGGLGLMPYFGVDFERRLGRRLWLLLLVRGHYQTGSQQAPATAADSHTSWSAGGSLGLRHALTPPQPLEVSWYAALDGDYSRARPGDGATAVARSAGAQLGLTLDKHLSEWFGIRLRASLLRAQYSSASHQAASAEAFSVDVVPSPSFALRFAW